MTLVRRAAEKISRFVVRHASTGCVEWAEGLAREADFIQSDWAALLWSLGSLRVLLDRRPAPIRTYVDLKQLVDKFVDGETKRYAIPLCSVINVVTYGLLFFLRRGSAMDHIGLLIAAIGWVVYGSFTYWDGRTRQKSIGDNDWPELIQLYRIQLERAGGLRDAPAQWMAAAGSLLFTTGYVIEYHSNGGEFWGAVLFLFFTSLFVLGRRNARRLLLEMDALLETKPLSQA
jgi:hypothetical protein